jgi:hypothetical protein
VKVREAMPDNDTDFNATFSYYTDTAKTVPMPLTEASYELTLTPQYSPNAAPVKFSTGAGNLVVLAPPNNNVLNWNVLSTIMGLFAPGVYVGKIVGVVSSVSRIDRGKFLFNVTDNT